MKRRVLIVAHTYYQMILAIQMRYTVFEDYVVVLLLSDYSRGAYQICEKINKFNIVDKCCFVRMQNILHNRNKINKIKDIIDIGLSDTNSFGTELSEIDNLFFDEFVCYNYRIDTYGIYSILSRYNEKIKMSFMEEGILSYNTVLERTKGRIMVDRMRHIRKKRALTDSLGNAYCFYPKMYRGEFDPVEVSPISSDSMCADALRKLFGLKDVSKEYTQKYIFFTSVYDFEGGSPIGEYDLVCRIADLIGKDNLLIKEHPRDTRNIYKSNGFNVDNNSAIPWEAIQLSGNFSEKIFMTATSGSVLAGSFMSEKPTKTFYMYNLCDITGNVGAQDTSRQISDLLVNESYGHVLENVKIINFIEEILK